MVFKCLLVLANKVVHPISIAFLLPVLPVLSTAGFLHHGQILIETEIDSLRWTFLSSGGIKVQWIACYK